MNKKKFLKIFFVSALVMLLCYLLSFNIEKDPSVSNLIYAIFITYIATIGTILNMISVIGFCIFYVLGDIE